MLFSRFYITHNKHYNLPSLISLAWKAHASTPRGPGFKSQPATVIYKNLE